MPSVKDIVKGAAARVGVDHRRLGRFRWISKARSVRRAGAPIRDHLGFVLGSPECDNFTYELDNEDELADWLIETLRADRASVAEFLLEARSNPAIYRRLAEVGGSQQIGRRLGWYVIVRVLKPTRVIETGIHDGIGSLVLLAALDRNREDGVEGDLVSFDPWEGAGWVVAKHPHWSPRFVGAEIGLRDALAEKGTGIFIHDSLHTREHETLELTIAANGMESGVLLSDNSHVTTVLEDLCTERGFEYSFFRERPRDHFYPGAGIGVGRIGLSQRRPTT